MQPLILIVEDEPDIAGTLGRYLERAGLRVVLAHDGRRGLELFVEHRPSLVILDLMLPGLGGLEVLRSLRLLGSVPVVALTALVSQNDRLRGFELGADDYVPKPFYPLEVVSRVQALLRRSGVGRPLEGRGGLTLDSVSRRVQQGGHHLELRPSEFALLSAFLLFPDRVFSRSELLDALGHETHDTLERTVDVHIRNLRQKLGPDHGICTVFGSGYRYERA
ncbi:response regulator transcription factor [Deinococcus sp.]|uniref:response regulator transcription factor n=1 Tax=Deinococcus sp. TaxID=47478 RepID=UPI002869E214|nr:response regulator transcription factor [Deinococcus sp.]